MFIGSDDMPSFEVRFKNTPVEEEALREVLTEHVDFPHVREVYRRVREGELKIETWKGSKPTPLAYHIVRRYLEVPEALSPEADREQSAQRMRQFLQTERVTLLCFECGTMLQGAVVGDLPERPQCAQCQSPVLGVLSWHGTPIKDALARHQQGEELPEEEAKELTRTRQGADMVAVYGRKAVLALSVYGVGPQAAAKILAKMHRKEEDFFRDLYDAKLRYVMTRPFWDRVGGGTRELVAKPSAYNQREGASTERRI
jgi:ATP-dependent Lhr-like helicase